MSIKVLYCASASSHLKNFHMPYIKWLSENGCEVTALTGDDKQALPFTAGGNKKVGFTKKFLSMSNIRAIFDVRRILTEGKYDSVITNTTLAGAVVRAAIKLSAKRQRPRVLHICHGFLFNTGDGLKKHLLLLPERICASVTNIYAVMNRESESIAKRYKLGGQVIFTHGMGVDISKFRPYKTVDNAKETTTESYDAATGGPEHSDRTKHTKHDAIPFNFVYTAEFSRRKNHAQLIRVFADAAPKMPGARLVLAGDGMTLDDCNRLAYKLGIAERIDFLGYVRDIPSLLAGCDVAVSSARYEGLPFNIMEAMAGGLPVIASDIAGHRDLLKNCDSQEQGSLYKNETELTDKLNEQYSHGKRRVEYPNIGCYTLDNVKKEWINIFEILFGETFTANFK